MGSPLRVGETVRYSLAGLKATQPPDPAVRGVVVEADPYQVLVRWPMGLGLEDPAHLRRPRRAAKRKKPSSYRPGQVSVRGATVLEDRPWTVDGNGCWNWLGATLDGYGVCGPGRAHRVVWTQSGREIPEGYDLHHKCENPLCVNPDHMEPLSPRVHRPRHWRSHRLLTLEQAHELRELARTTDLTYAQLAERFGINWSTVQNIVAGHKWPEVFKGEPARRERTCRHCGKPLSGSRSKRYCAALCRERDGRARRAEQRRAKTSAP